MIEDTSNIEIDYPYKYTGLHDKCTYYDDSEVHNFSKFSERYTCITRCVLSGNNGYYYDVGKNGYYY